MSKKNVSQHQIRFFFKYYKKKVTVATGWQLIELLLRHQLLAFKITLKRTC